MPPLWGRALRLRRRPLLLAFGGTPAELPLTVPLFRFPSHLQRASAAGSKKAGGAAPPAAPPAAEAAPLSRKQRMLRKLGLAPQAAAC